MVTKTKPVELPDASYMSEAQAAIAESQALAKTIIDEMKSLNPGLDHEKLSINKMHRIMAYQNQVMALQGLALLKLAQSLNATQQLVHGKKAGIDIGSILGGPKK